MTDLIAEIEQEVTNAVVNDELDLPILPEVALRIRDVAERPDVSALALGDVIAEDPGLSARMVKMANSPMFRGVNPIEDLNMALARLGVEYAANLATGLAMQQMFQATSELVDRKLRQIWAQATDIAAICGVMSKTFTPLRPDEATLAGLTHSIGTLPILSWAEENPSLLSDSITLDRVIESIHGSLGTMILQSWEFTNELAMVPAQYHDFQRVSESVCYSDVVTVAYLHSLSGSDHPDAKQDWSAIDAFKKLGLEADSDEIELEDLAEKVDDAKGIFS